MSSEMSVSTQPLGELVEILSGFPFKSEAFSADPNEGTPLIRIRDIKTHAPSCSFVGNYDPAYLIGDGDIIVGMDGEFTAIRWQGVPALLNQRVLKIRSSRPGLLDEDYLFHRIHSDLAHLETVISGTTVKHLSVKDIRRLEWCLPPLDEQRRIAEVLRSVDEVIAHEIKVREAAEASLEHAIAALIPIPEIADSDWTATTIGEFATVITGKTPSTKDQGLWGGEIPFVTPTDMDGSVRSVRAARTVTKAAVKHTKIAPANSVLFTCIASIGKLCLNHEPVAFNQQINACACRDGTDAAFLYWTLRRLAPQIRAMSGTTAVPIVNKSDFSRVSFAVPPSATRREIVEVLSSISEVVEAARHTISSLTELKPFISSDLLSGRVRVPA